MYSSLGDAYNSLKDYTASDTAFEKALSLDPANATVLNNYAYYLSERGVRLSYAEKLSKQSLRLSPNQPTFLDTYGWILYKQGNLTGAADYIRQAVDAVGQNDGTVWEHLGDIQFKQGKKEEAVRSWQKAREKGSESPNLDKKISEQKLFE
jgi:Tfp pilus assembly protein PilF